MVPKRFLEIEQNLLIFLLKEMVDFRDYFLENVVTLVDLRFESFLPGTKNHQNVDGSYKNSVTSFYRHLPPQNENFSSFCRVV